MGNESFRRELLNKLLKFYGGKFKPEKVLEVGAGAKFNSKEYFPTAQEYLTINPDELSEPDYIGVGEKLPFKVKQFDLVITLETLEHCIDPVKFIKECHRVLKKNGILILSIPFLTPIHMELDHWRYTGKGLNLLLSKNFRVLKNYQMGGTVESILQILHMQYRKRALIFFLPFMKMMLRFLERFKINPISGSTGYFVIAQKQ